MAMPLNTLLRVLIPVLLAACLACDLDDDDYNPPLPDGPYACTDIGGHCGDSADCCGVLLCNESGVCSDGICVGPGSHCQDSADCCGTAFCESGFCFDYNAGCVLDGEHCRSSYDCCGASLCQQGICQGGAGSCVGTGYHCITSSDCCGSDLCNLQDVCE